MTQWATIKNKKHDSHPSQRLPKETFNLSLCIIYLSKNMCHMVKSFITDVICKSKWLNNSKALKFKCKSAYIDFFRPFQFVGYQAKQTCATKQHYPCNFATWCFTSQTACITLSSLIWGNASSVYPHSSPVVLKAFENLQPYTLSPSSWCNTHLDSAIPQQTWEPPPSRKWICILSNFIFEL